MDRESLDLPQQASRKKKKVRAAATARTPYPR
jgi:hypothetical protein